MMSRAFITIEVLVAMLILFLTIATLSTTSKFFTTTKIKKEQYEAYYRAFLNIKDKLSQQPCESHQGSFNDFSYTLTCNTIKQLRNYQPAFDEGDEAGNIGPFLYHLNKNRLTITKKNLTKSITYFTTSYQHD